MPPRVVPHTARQIRLEHVDRGVKSWFKDVVGLKVSDPTAEAGERRPVHVTFAAGERWVAAADRDGVRDKDGQLILPVIEIFRQGFDMSSDKIGTGLGANVPTMQVARQIADKTSRLANNDSSRPISQRRLKSGAVFEVWTIPFPVTGVMPYSVTIRAQFQQQINEIVEKIMYNLEFFDVSSFLIEIDGNSRPQGIPTGKGSTEVNPADHQLFGERHPLTDYYVVGYIDGSIQSQGNVKEFTDQERVLEVEFSFNVPVALQLDPEGERPAIERQLTATDIILEEETCTAVDSLLELDIIFGPK